MAVKYNPYLAREKAAQSYARRSSSMPGTAAKAVQLLALSGKALPPALKALGQAETYKNAALTNEWLPSFGNSELEYNRGMGWGELNSYSKGALTADSAKYDAMLKDAYNSRIAQESAYTAANPDAPGYTYNTDTMQYDPNAAMQAKLDNFGTINTDLSAAPSSSTTQMQPELYDTYFNDPGIAQYADQALSPVSTDFSYGLPGLSSAIDGAPAYMGLDFGYNAGAEMAAQEAGLWGLNSTIASQTAASPVFSSAASELGYNSGFAGLSSPAAEAVSSGLEAPVSFDWMGSGAIGSGVMGGVGSVASDLLAGKSVNIGKAATTAGGAYAGAAIGTALAPGPGTIVGSVLGSTIGSIVGGGSIICGEWVQKGSFDKKTYNKLWKFARKYYSNTMIRGYHVWATPIVKRMKSGSKIATWFTDKVFGAYVKELMYKAGLVKQPNYLGKVLQFVCEPITWVIGALNDKDPVNKKWDKKNISKPGAK